MSQQRGPASNLSPEIVPPVFRNNPAMSGQLLNAQASPYRPDSPQLQSRIVAQAHQEMGREGIPTVEQAKLRKALVEQYKQQGREELQMPNGSVVYKDKTTADDWSSHLHIAEQIANLGRVIGFPPIATVEKQSNPDMEIDGVLSEIYTPSSKKNAVKEAFAHTRDKDRRNPNPVIKTILEYNHPIKRDLADSIKKGFKNSPEVDEFFFLHYKTLKFVITREDFVRNRIEETIKKAAQEAAD